MRYSYKILSEYINGKIETKKLIEFTDILGLNPAIIEKNEDVIFELEIPANRGDLLCLIGIVREILPFTENKLLLSETDFQEEINEQREVKIENKEDCLYYSCRIIRNIENIFSTSEFVKKISKLGFKSSFLPVDISNFVMAETGQPIHIFDLDTLEGEIIVRRGRKGEKITGLDGKEYEVNPEVLVIADSKKAVAIAGIIGGMNSCVTEKTKNILIESALFNPVVVRRGSKKLGIITEASARFEKGICLETTEMGMKRTTYLVKKFCSGKIGKLNYSGEKKSGEIEVKLRKEKVEKVVGAIIEEKFIETLFKKLNFNIRKDKDIFIVKVPSYRKDIKEEIDLIEEIARYRNYSSIKEDIPNTTITPTHSDEKYKKYEKIKDILSNFGFSEIITLSLISEDLVKILGFECLKIENPLSSNFAFLRPNLFIQMLDIFRTNVNHQVRRANFFEIGKIYKRENGELKEEMHLSLGTLNNGDFYNLKGAMEEFAKLCNLENLNYKTETGQFSAINGLQSILYNGVKIGEIFIPKKELLEKFEIEKEQVYISEIYIEKLIDDISFEKKFKELPKFPFSRRDFSFILPFTVNWEEIEKEIFGEKMPVERIEVFDIFKGKNIPSGKISISFSVYFRSEEKTLSAEEIEEFSKKIISIIEKNFGGNLRSEKT